MRKITLIFGGDPIQVKEPPYKHAKKWRADLESRLGELTAAIDGDLMSIMMEAAALQIPAAGDADPGQFEKAGDLFEKLTPALGGILKTVVSAPDEAAEMVFSYFPDLDRDEIEDVAYTDEFIPALYEVIKSAYPFLSIKATIQAALDQIGQAGRQIGANSGSANGAAGIETAKGTAGQQVSG